MGQKTVVVPRGVISTKVDNNHNFWLTAYERVIATVAVPA
jgi:hypothetical protein